MTSPLWQPSAERVANARLTEFRDRYADHAVDFAALHAWSVESREEFWSAIWEYCEVQGSRGNRLSANRDSMPGAQFFPDATLNYARNLLRGPDDGIAIIACAEDGDDRTLTWCELRTEVARVSAALKADGVRPGDCVVAFLPNVPETVIVMLGAVAIGATFSSCSPDFGANGVLDRFGQIDPVVLVTASTYSYAGRIFDVSDRITEIQDGLPTLRRTVVVESQANIMPTATTSWSEWLDPHRDVTLEFEELSFDHPLYVLYSSGTTGAPKCIIHRAGGVLLKHLAEQQLQCDVHAGDRVMYFTTTGWMMWNWLVGALSSSATIVLVDGSPFHPTPFRLFDIAEQHGVSLVGVGAKFLDALRKENVRPREIFELSKLRTICSTGSPLAAEGFEYVYSAIKTDVHLASISGGTDLCGCIVMGDPTRSVIVGEIQGPALGVAADVFSQDGSRAAAGEAGDLVVTTPFPSMPLRFVSDPDGSKYEAAYFSTFPGVWAQGDFAYKTVNGGFVITGRSDATLNPGGVRIGTGELYRCVEALPEVLEALAVGQPYDGDTRIVLFVRLAAGVSLDAVLEAHIRSAIRNQCSPRHVPARIIQISDLPRTRSGKIAELAVADLVSGRDVRNTFALANPESLEQFKDRPELVD